MAIQKEVRIRIRDDSREGGAGVKKTLSDIGREALRANDPLKAVVSGIRAINPAAIAAAAGIGVAIAAVSAITIGLRLLSGAISKANAEWAPFQQGMRNVAAVSGATDAELKKLSSTALELASATRFNPKQVSEGLYALGSAGQSVNEQLASLPGVLNFAEAAQADLGLATEITVGALNVFGLAASETNRVVDVFTAAIASSSLNADRLQVAMRNAGPAADALGYGIEETTAAVALLTSKFNSGELAGTGYKSALQQIAKKSDELGISVLDSAGAMLPMVDIIRNLEEEGVSAQKVMFALGNEGGPAMAALLQLGSEALAEMTEKIQSSGQAAKTAAEQLNTLKGDQDRLASAITEFWVRLGDIADEGSRSITQSQLALAQSLVDFLKTHEVELKAFVSDVSESVEIVTGAFEDWKPVIEDLTPILSVLAVQIRFAAQSLDLLVKAAENSKALRALVIFLKPALDALSDPDAGAKRFGTALGGANAFRDEMRGFIEAVKAKRVAEDAATAATDKHGNSVKALRAELRGLNADIREHEEGVRKSEERIRAAEKAYSDFTDALGDASKAYDGLDIAEITSLLESQGQAIPTTAEGWRDLAKGIANVEKALDELGRHTQLIDSPDLAPSSVIFDIPGAREVEDALRAMRESEDFRKVATAEIARLLKEGKISIDEAFRISHQLGLEFEHWTTTLIDGFAAIGAIVGEFDRDLGRAISRAADLLALYQQVGANISNTQALGAVAGNVQSANNPNYAVYGAIAGAIIGGLIGAYFGGPGGAQMGAKWGAVIGSWLGGMIKKGIPEFYGSIKAELGEAVIGPSAMGGGFEKIGRAFGKQIAKAIDDILFMVGAELESIAAGIDIKTKKGTSVFIDGQEFSFKEDTEAAISFAITEALKRATITGASPEVIAALANTIATDLDQLFADLEVAVKIRDINLDEIQRTFRAIAQEFDFLRKRAEELGMGIAALNNIATAEVTAFGALKNQILGIEEDPAARIRRQAAMFNAELALRRLDLESRKAALQAEAAILRTRIQLEGSGLELDRSMLEAQLAIFGVEADIVKAMLETAASAAEALALITEQIATLDSILAGLAGLEITDADINKAIGNIGKGGGSSKKADRAQLEDMLREHEISKLGDLARAHHDVNKKWDDAIKLAHGDAEAIERIARARQEEIDAINQQAIGDAYGDLLKFQHGKPKSQLSSDLAGVKAEADRLRGVFAELGETLGWSAERMEIINQRIRDAAQAQRQVILESAAQDLLLNMLDFLGKGEEAERMRFEIQKAQLLIAYAELKIAAEKYNIELELLKKLGELVGELEGFEFEDFRPPPVQDIRRTNDGFDEMADKLRRLADRLVSAKDRIRDFLNSLDRNEFGGLSPEDALENALGQFDTILAAARGGDIGALEAFPEASSNLLKLAREFYASGPEFAAIFDMVRRAGIDLLEVRRAREGNVIFDERFYESQQQQVDLQSRMVELLEENNAMRRQEQASRNRAA